MTARPRTLPREGQGNFRLYITVRHDGRDFELSEGPYRFRTKRDALTWLAGQRHVTVTEATLFHGEELIAKANADGPVEISS